MTTFSGAELSISHHGTLTIASVQQLLDEYLEKPELQDVLAYATKMNDGLYHIYFTAANENGDYKTASEDFKILFDQSNIAIYNYNLKQIFK